MGLAPYGKQNVDLPFFCHPQNESFFVDLAFFRSRKNATQYEPYYSTSLLSHLGEPRRRGQAVNDYHRNVAGSAQDTLKACIMNLVSSQLRKTGSTNLCLAGGVAQNCSANGKIEKLRESKNLFVASGAADRGLALGAAFHVAKLHGETISPISHVFYGPTRSQNEIEQAIKTSGVKYEVVDNPCEKAAELLAENKIVGWFQGRSEFGPRALGHRSILANPGRPEMKNEINKRIKFREEFRPFAPSVLIEKAFELYDLKNESPYMSIACNTKKIGAEKTPATTHVNGTSRVQTVNKNIDHIFDSLISSFNLRTGCPAVLNTSLNIMGQPIVVRPLEAISTFFGCGMDSLFINKYLIKK